MPENREKAGERHEQGRAAAEAPRLEMRGCSKAFPGVQALSDVSLTVRAGEVRALVGENGAGKSTLMNILDGVFADYEGEILIDGRAAAIRSPRAAQAHRISMIHQELHLVPELSIADNIFLGREPRTLWGTVDRARMRRDAAALLAELDLPVPPTRLVRLCRLAEQQLVEVAKALSLDARILIMDEPTSALADAEIRQLFRVIAGLSARGVSVIYISHRLEELAEIAGSVTVLRDGELIGTHPIGDVTRDQLIRMMVGRPLKDFFVKADAGGGAAADCLRVDHLSLKGDRGAGRRALHDISFSVREGEVVGLAGLMGAGRTEVLETIFGAHPRRLVSGEVDIAGRRVTIRSPRQAIRAGLAFLTEDRKGQSLATMLSVRFNITLASLRRLLRWFGLDRRRERSIVLAQIARLRIKTPSPATVVNTLSGGNQQKVALAKSLLTEPKVVLMDEPTRGIDVGGKAEIYGLINELAQAGTGILMVSSEMPELLAMCDRILVLCEGRVTAELDRAEATQERILEAATPTETVLAHAT
jgi:ribose transport system ATP-binding protein